MSDLAKLLSEIMQAIADYGWQPPMCFVFLGVNGSVIAGIFRDRGDGTASPDITVVTKELEFVYPLNLMVVSTDGQHAARAKIEPNTKPTFNWN